MPSSDPQAYAVCINNAGYAASLEAGKLYQVPPDADARRHGLLRLIDESGEDYGYSADRFYLLDLPGELRDTPAALVPQAVR